MRSPSPRRTSARCSTLSARTISTASAPSSTRSSSSWTLVAATPCTAGTSGAFCDVFVTAFPDLTQEVQLLVDAGEYAFAEVVARGTHTGPLATPEGDIGPTGRTIEVPFCVVVHARDGLLVDG